MIIILKNREKNQILFWYVGTRLAKGTYDVVILSPRFETVEFKLKSEDINRVLKEVQKFDRIGQIRASNGKEEIVLLIGLGMDNFPAVVIYQKQLVAHIGEVEYEHDGIVFRSKSLGTLRFRYCDYNYRGWVAEGGE